MKETKTGITQNELRVYCSFWEREWRSTSYNLRTHENKTYHNDDELAYVKVRLIGPMDKCYVHNTHPFLPLSHTRIGRWKNTNGKHVGDYIWIYNETSDNTRRKAPLMQAFIQ